MSRPLHRRGSSRTAPRLLLAGNGEGNKVHLRTGTLHLPLGLRPPSLKCDSLSPVPSSTPGHVAGHGLGCRRATAIAAAASAAWPDQTEQPPSARRMSPTRMHGEVPCPGPPLAWEASVNAALIAAARPATGIIRQLLIRICILPRSVLCPVPASSGTAQEGSTSHSVSTLKALMPAPVKAEGRALTTHSTATRPHLAEMYWREGRNVLPQETTDQRRPGVVLRPFNCKEPEAGKCRTNCCDHVQ